MAQPGSARIRVGYFGRTIKWAAVAAALLLGASARAAAQADSSWRFAIVPYFWASDLTGHVGIGPITTRVDESFRDLVKILKFGAMGSIEARYRSYVAGLDFIYSNVGNGKSIAIRGDTGGFSFGLKEAIWNPMIGYQFHHGAWGVEPFFGIRYWDMASTLDVDRLNGTSHEHAKGIHWIDAAPGARVDWIPYRRTRVLVGGDVGGGGAKNTWQAYGTVGWDAATWWTISGGYRSLSVDYQHNLLVLDTNMKGPIITMAFRF